MTKYVFYIILLSTWFVLKFVRHSQCSFNIFSFYFVGKVDKALFISSRLFHSEAHPLADLIIGAQQHNSFIYVGCNATMSLLPPQFLHDSDYKFYITPRSVQRIRQDPQGSNINSDRVIGYHPRTVIKT